MNDPNRSSAPRPQTESVPDRPSDAGDTNGPDKSPNQGASAAPIRRWRWNKTRAAWVLAGLLLGMFSTSWFCWLQKPPAIGVKTTGTWEKLWYPREINAYKRLCSVPHTDLEAGFFTNGFGWVVGMFGIILHTDNGGESWSWQTNVDWQAASAAGGSLLPSLCSVSFVNGKTGWATGEYGTILHTEDGGQKWQRQTCNVSERIGSVVFVDSQNGWAVGDDGDVLWTKDGGRYWTNKTVVPGQGLLSLSFVDTFNGWVASSEGQILHTTNGGEQWNIQYPKGKDRAENAEGLVSIRFADAQNGTAVGGTGLILHTTNGGLNWEPQESKIKHVLKHVRFFDKDHALANGDGGVILKTENGGGNWIETTNRNFSKVISLAIESSTSAWAMGSSGTILKTVDGGRSWSPQTANSEQMDFSSVTFVNAESGWVVGENGTVLHTENGGQDWIPQIVNTSANLTSIAFVNSRTGWIVADDGSIVHTENGGHDWLTQTNLAQNGLKSITFSSPQNGWVVGMFGTVLHTENGGKNWIEQSANTDNDLNSVAFIDNLRGWIAGSKGTILYTTNGGRNWDPQQSKTTAELQSVVITKDGFGWAVGSDITMGFSVADALHTDFTKIDRSATILHTEDGQDWLPQASHTRDWLQSVQFLDAKSGWAVGGLGTILHTEDAGRSWILQTTNATGVFNSVSFHDPLIGWVAGAYGTLIHTKDGGLKWRDSLEYSRFPAPIFYVLFVTSLVFVTIGLVIGESDDPIINSIADFAVSDRPLTSSDFDALNFGPLVQGIASFLRNNNTTGPLTLAVVGEWGSGKSSIMGLLQEKLERLGVCTVWFNAWHHQDEKQLLAALLESIQTQAVPRWFSWRGLIFRINLINCRMRNRWVTMFLGIAFLAALAATFVWLGDGFSLDAITAGKLAVVITAGVTFYKFIEGLRAFGLDPAKLLASVTDKAKLSELGELAGFRQHFTTEFKEVTQALQPRTMTIFIDDLDRCDPACVMEIMQSLNFLATSGECFMVVGMEEDAVTNCVAIGLKEQFNTEKGKKLEEEKAIKARWDYAEKWMEKLIQIRVPVPKSDDEQFKALLIGRRLAPWQFSPDEIKDLPLITERLRQHADPITDLLWALLEPPGQDLLAKGPRIPTESNRTRQLVVGALNKAIGGPSLYGKTPPQFISFRAETLRLAEQDSTEQHIPSLNRLLLEDLFPRELSRRVELNWRDVVSKWLKKGWRLSSPILPWAALVAVAIGSFWAVWGLTTTQPLTRIKVLLSEKPAASWPSNSLIRPESLKAVRLNSPAGITGSSMITNSNLQGWIGTQKWAVELEFAPNIYSNISAAREKPDVLPNRGPQQRTRDLHPVASSAPADIVGEGQKDRRSALIAFFLLLLALAIAARKLVDIYNERYDDSEDFRDSLRRWSDLIRNSAETPRAAKRLVNKLRFYALMSRALKNSKGKPDVPANAVVAFGVNEENINGGGVEVGGKLSEALQNERQMPQSQTPRGSLKKDLEDMETALKDHPEVFGWLSSTVKKKHPKSDNITI